MPLNQRIANYANLIAQGKINKKMITLHEKNLHEKQIILQQQQEEHFPQEEQIFLKQEEKHILQEENKHILQEEKQSNFNIIESSSGEDKEDDSDSISDLEETDLNPTDLKNQQILKDNFIKEKTYISNNLNITSNKDYVNRDLNKIDLNVDKKSNLLQVVSSDTKRTQSKNSYRF